LLGLRRDGVITSEIFEKLVVEIDAALEIDDLPVSVDETSLHHPENEATD
jgi:hypothetical protein